MQVVVCYHFAVFTSSDPFKSKQSKLLPFTQAAKHSDRSVFYF